MSQKIVSDFLKWFEDQNRSAVHFHLEKDVWIAAAEYYQKSIQDIIDIYLLEIRRIKKEREDAKNQDPGQNEYSAKEEESKGCSREDTDSSQ